MSEFEKWYAEERAYQESYGFEINKHETLRAWNAGRALAFEGAARICDERARANKTEDIRQGFVYAKESELCAVCIRNLAREEARRA